MLTEIKALIFVILVGSVLTGLIEYTDRVIEDLNKGGAWQKVFYRQAEQMLEVMSDSKTG